MRHLASLIALAAITGAACRPSAPPTVTIAHFNDVYEIDAVEDGHSGGLARVATRLRELERTAGPVLSTLGGDYLSPSAIGTARVDGQRLDGKQMVDVLNGVGLQWATFGNHEFDVSEASFRQRMAEQKFRLVSSNVTDANGRPFEGTLTSAVSEVTAGGRKLRIGFIGVTLDANRKPWVKYSPPIEAARAAIAEVRQSGAVDAIVALTHLSLLGDQQLAAAVPDIDVILGGHEHENWMLMRGSHFTPIIKADANVRSLAVVTLAFGGPGTRPTVSSRIDVMDDRVQPDAQVSSAVQKWKTIAFDAFRKDGFQPEAEVVTTPQPLDGRESTVRNRPDLLTDIIAAGMIREAGGADAAIFNGGSVRIDDVVPAGPITEYDIIRILPFGGKVVKVTMDGTLLADILDAGLRNQGVGGYLQTGGISRENGRWMVQGKPIAPATRYTVALTDFLLTGAEANLDFLKRDNKHIYKLEELRDVRQGVIAELKARYR